MGFDAFGSFGLATGGETLAPAAARPLDRSGVVVVFDVPDDFTEGVLTSRPTWTLFFGDEQATLDATAETVAIDFR